MKLETAINIRNKCSIPIVSNFKPDMLHCYNCYKCSLFKKVKLEETNSIISLCVIVTSFLEVRITAENFFIQIKEDDFVEVLCKDLVDEVLKDES